MGERGIGQRASAVWSLMAEGRASLEHPEHPATFGSSCQLPDLLTGLPPLRNAYEVPRVCERERGGGREREGEGEKESERASGEREREREREKREMCFCVSACARA